MATVTRLLVLHGPNLNLLGEREPEIYGNTSLEEIDERIRIWAKQESIEARIAQSNSEGTLIDLFQDMRQWADGVVLNPGGLTHTSVSLADAIRATGLPVVEVHLSNIFAREPFRQQSMMAGACIGIVAGFGPDGYIAACTLLKRFLESSEALD